MSEYRIAGNFCWWKLSRIGENVEFHRENFRSLPIGTVGLALLRESFVDKTFTKGGNTAKVSSYTVCE